MGTDFLSKPPKTVSGSNERRVKSYLNPPLKIFFHEIKLNPNYRKESMRDAMRGLTFGTAESLFRLTYHRYGPQGCKLLGFSGVIFGIGLFWATDLISFNLLAIIIRFLAEFITIVFAVEWYLISIRPPRN